MRSKQGGAALLTAMLTVTLVATLASTMLWQQWRNVEIETAERERSQLAWLLTGALDWARLILREDARASQVDHLSEPWALPLQEARLSSFLALDNSHAEDGPQAFLSGQITDQQARLNVLNLVDGGRISAPALATFERLFRRLGLPEAELQALANNLRAASANDNTQPAAPLLPQKVAQLGWLGVSPRSLQLLTPYITLLPARTPLNLNTADAEVIHASVPGLEPAQAQRLVQTRALSHFRSVDEALKSLGGAAQAADASRFSVASRFFEVRGRLRLDNTVVQERSLVERQEQEVKIVWREREIVDAPMTGHTASLQ